MSFLLCRLFSFWTPQRYLIITAAERTAAFDLYKKRLGPALGRVGKDAMLAQAVIQPLESGQVLLMDRLGVQILE